MKKIYSIAIMASMLLSGISANAQGTIELSKKVKDNQNGTYTLTLESYITGTEVTKPIDIVLVLDNSNSMYGYDGGAAATALKTAVTSFLDNLLAKSNGLQHQVSIVKFQGGGRRIYTYLNFDSSRVTDICGKWIQMTQSDINTAKAAVNDLHTGQSPRTGETYTTGTPAADGLYYARTLLTTGEIASDGRPKVVIFFTDGCCGTGEAWGVQTTSNNNQKPDNNQLEDWGYEKGTVIPNRYYAKKVVDEANELKKNGITVFSVGCFRDWKTWNPNGSGNNASTQEQKAQRIDTYFYLKHISSKYNSAIIVDGEVPETAKTGVITADQHPKPSTTDYSYDKPFVSIDEGDLDDSIENEKYVFASTEKDELISNFQKILGTIIDSPDLGSSTSVVLDALTNMFKLPAGTLTDPANQIHLYTCDAQNTTSLKWATTGGDVTVHKDDNNNIIEEGGTTESWKTWKPWTNNTDDSWENYLRINPSNPVSGVDSGSDIIEVTGYDFKSNWVGTRTGGNYGGQKLIIQFDILPDPSNTGGVVNMLTNDPSSGIYAYNSKTGKYENTGKFEEPKVKLPYLKIIKNGLGSKQSAIFKVTKVNGLTDSTPDTTTPFSTMVVISGNTKPEAVVKLIYTGFYLVEEMTWSWEFQSTVVKDKQGNDHTGNSLIQQLSTVTAETYDENGYLVYEFTNNNEKTTPNHAESYIMNKMFVNTYPTTD